MQKIPTNKRVFTWPKECDIAFNNAKLALANVTLISFPRNNAKISIATDASNSGIDAVLQQETEKGWEPLGFFSKKLNDNQTKYSPFDLELLAIYEAIKHFRYFVEGRDFKIFTDHKPLENALFKKSPRSLVRNDIWILFHSSLQTFVTLKELIM